MNTEGPITIILIIANIIISWKGFNDPAFFMAWSFETDQVLVYKRYGKLLTSGFLHTGWMHLIFNMLGLYFFGGTLENMLGSFPFLLVYLSSLVGGNGLALLIHRNHPSYSAVGASGAVYGIIFSAIALFPGMQIGVFFLLSIPSWLFGILFVAFTIYGIRSGSGNIGHEAHLGGALIGMAITILLHPSCLAENTLAILAITLPSVVFIYYHLNRPRGFSTGIKTSRRRAKVLSIDQRYNLEKNELQKEIDRILEKVHRKGMDSLTKSEKDTLNDYSSSK